VHLVVQMLFPNNVTVSKVDSSPIHMARSVQFWFEEGTSSLASAIAKLESNHPEVFSFGLRREHLPWPVQSSNLNIIEPLWSVLESRVRSTFLPTSSLKQLEDVLHEGWHSIPLQTIQNLDESIARRIQAVLQANGGSTLY